MSTDSSHEQQKEQEQDRLFQSHLGWSDRQGRILSADGRATELYCASRGFPFDEAELPHHLLARGETRAAFDAWKRRSLRPDDLLDDSRNAGLGIVGAWFRALFVGESDFTTFHDEDAISVQTRTLFVDLRIPRSRNEVALAELRCRTASSLDDLVDGNDLRWYARQHVFAGYSRLTGDQRPGMAGCCVRHHCLDWNYVGISRPVPNKWWMEVPAAAAPRHHERTTTTTTTTTVPRRWKEWAFATNDAGHPYYGEVWERLLSSGSDPVPARDGQLTDRSRNDPNEDASAHVVMALRKRASGRTSDDEHANEEDGVVVVVGDHFNYCVGRPLADGGTPPDSVAGPADGAAASSLVDLVDAAVARGDFATARAWLGRLRGGHGRVSSGWKIDLATDFWREGSPFWDPKCVAVVGESIETCILQHGNDEWEVFECSLTSIDALKSFLLSPSSDYCASGDLQSSSKRPRLEGEE